MQARKLKSIYGWIRGCNFKLSGPGRPAEKGTFMQRAEGDR